MFLVISGTSKHNMANFCKCCRIVFNLLSCKQTTGGAAVTVSGQSE